MSLSNSFSSPLLVFLFTRHPRGQMLLMFLSHSLVSDYDYDDDVSRRVRDDESLAGGCSGREGRIRFLSYLSCREERAFHITSQLWVWRGGEGERQRRRQLRFWGRRGKENDGDHHNLAPDGVDWEERLADSAVVVSLIPLFELLRPFLL